MSAPTDPIYNGRYEIRSQIARGGTAQVYLARDLMLDRPVALKVLYPELSADHSFVERFRREAQAAANLSQPNIVPVFDWGESERTYFIVMEYVDGEPLSSIIRTQAPLEPAQAASIAGEIAKALSYAHRHGVVHRDVKPGNVLITSDGEVKVTDFGIARAIGSDEQVTQTGLVMGTATYFSPEQAQGLAVDGRSDIYSLGVVLYEMLTGKPPFTGDNPVTIAYQHVRESPATPRSVEPAIPVALEAIVLQAMAKLPAERYSTAEEMRADLERFVRGQTVLARPPVGDVPDPLTAAMPRSQSEGVRLPDSGERVRSTTPAWTAAAIVLALVLVAAVVLGGRALGYFGGAPYFKVPDVEGLSASAAHGRLTSVGLHYSTHTVNATATDAGDVISQQPGYPATVRRGAVVTLTVGGRAPNGSIPKVTNLAVSRAEKILQQKHFKAKVVYIQATNPSQLQGYVVSQKPAAGAAKPLESRVTLDVVRGKKFVIVPPLANDNQAHAGAQLTEEGLEVGTTTPGFSSTVAAGNVISSTPPSGSSVGQGTVVNLIISEGPGVVVPSLLGESESQAEATLQSDGLMTRVGALYPTIILGYIGTVASQNPKASTQVATNSTVTIRIGACSTACEATSTTTSTIPTTTPPPGGTTGTVPGT